MAGIVLSPGTYERVRRLISERDGATVGHGHGTGVRQVIHVRVTGEPDEERKYACVPTAYKPDDGSWDDYSDGECYVFEANEQDLRVGDRYVAIRYGIIPGGEGTADKWIFVADNMYPLLKCHLEWKQDPDDYDKWKLDVTPETLAGCGLELQVDGTCDKLKVNPYDLAGCGLIPAAENSDSSSGAPGCKLDVDAEALAGCGLKAADASEGGCQLEIDMEEVDGPTFTAITSIDPSGCGLSYTVQTYTVKTNACGVFIGLEETSASTYAVEFSDCCSSCSCSCACSCCPDCSSSCDCPDCSCDSSSSDSSSSSDDECAGWYCCSDTGTVQYVADCTEFAALADCGGSSGDEEPTPCSELEPPSTLTATVTGDCPCWNGTYTLTGSGSGWYYSAGFCGGEGGINLTCDNGNWMLIMSYQSNSPTFGAGCILGSTSGNSVSPTGPPFNLVFTAGVTPWLGETCCGGSVTVTITG